MDVYKIGVSLAMSSNAPQVLQALSSHLLGVHAQVNQLQGGLNNLKVALGGVFAIAAGVGLAKGMGELVSKGSDLVHIQEQMRAAGIANKDIADATAKAWEVSGKVGTVGVSRALEMIKELRGVFGDTQHAQEFALDFAKSQTVIDAVTKGRNKDQVFDAAKAIELRGQAFDPVKFRHEIDLMTKAVTAYGGKVTPADMFQFMKYSRGASFGYSEDFMFRVAPALIQEGGASSVGTALKSLDQAIVGGKLSNKAALEFMKYGLLDSSKVDFDKVGRVKRVHPGAIQNAAEFSQNPYVWVQSTLVPALQRGGIKFDNPAAVREILATLFGNRTAEWIAAILTTQKQRIDKEIEIAGSAKGLDAFDALKDKDPSVAMKSFTTAWNNLLTAMGSPLVESSVQALNAISSAINSMSQFVAAHPEAVKIIGLTLAGLAAGLAAIGAVLVGGAVAAALGAGGWLVVGITAVGAFVGTLVALNWDEIKNLGAKAWEAIKGIGETMSTAIQALPGQVAGAISGAFSAIGSYIKNSISSMFGFGGSPAAPKAPAGSDGGAAPGAPRPSAVPPAASIKKSASVGDVYLDGRKVGTHVARALSQGANGPTLGTALFDGSRHSTPNDFAFG